MMQAELFSCGVCRMRYDVIDHVPKVIPSCGHTICLSCLNGILKSTEIQCCPLDNIPFLEETETNQQDPFPVNIVMIQLLEERDQRQAEVCVTHGEPSNLICLKDNHQICKSCANSSMHRGHPIRHMNDIKSEGGSRKKHLELQMKEFQSCCNSLPYLLENEKDQIMRNLKLRFEEMKTLLTEKEQEIISGVESFFEIERMQVEKNIEQDNQLKNNLQDKIAFLSNHTIGERYLEALKGEIPKFEIIPKYEQLQKAIQENKHRFDEVLEKFNKALMSLLKQLQPKFPLCSARGVVANSQEELDILRVSNFFYVSQQNERLYFSLRSKGMDLNSCWDFGSFFNQSRRINKVLIDCSKGEITEDKIKAIAYPLRHLENLLDLQIDFSETEIKDQEFMLFCENSNWTINKMQSFKLELKNCCVGDEGLTKLNKEMLTKLTKLKALKIYLSGTNITNCFLQEFSVFPSLQEIRLDFSNTKVTGLGIEALSKALSEHARNIRILDMNFGNIEISDQSLKKFAELVLSKMTLLQDLWLTLENIQVSSEAIECFFLALQDVAKNLKAFGLNIAGLSNLKDENIETLAERVILKMEKVEKFSFHIADTRVTDSSIEKFFVNLNLVTKNIRMFILDLNRTSITGEGIRTFAKQILPAMNNLLRLEVNLEGVEVTEDDTKKLFLGIKSVMKNLKILTINLNKTNLASEKVIPSVSDMLALGIDLERLGLSFAEFKIKNDTFKHLFETVSNNMIKLKQIKLDLSYTQISDHNIEALITFIATKASTLKNLNVNLDGAEISCTKKEIIQLFESNINK